MEYEFYLDLFFLWVFFLDLLALYLASCLGRMPVRVPGFLAAAAAGSVCNCGLAVFPVLPAAAELFLAAAGIGSLMCWMAFSPGTPGELLKADGLLLGAACILGGSLFSLKEIFWLTDWESLAAASGAAVMAGLFFKMALREKERGRERFLVRLFYRGEQREFKALADSGNRLREPVSGKPVSVVYIGDLKGFCDSVDGVVYIPYRAVGTRAGLLPAVIFEKMEIVWEKRTVEIQRPVVAVAREPLSGAGGFPMRIPRQFGV